MTLPQYRSPAAVGTSEQTSVHPQFDLFFFGTHTQHFFLTAYLQCDGVSLDNQKRQFLLVEKK